MKEGYCILYCILVLSLLPFCFTFQWYSICYSSKRKCKIVNKQKLTINFKTLNFHLCVLLHFTVLLYPSLRATPIVQLLPLFAPHAWPLRTQHYWHSWFLRHQWGRYADNPQLAKYLDPPLQNEWSLTIWWLYHIQSRLQPRPPLTPWLTDSSWVQTNPDIR